jgi:L-alanine-DL-glutamate epimerase-like enolase superfamily enzyme
VTYVNHTFTSHLALSASLQPYAGLAEHTICEYPFAPKSLAWDLSVNHILPDDAGEVAIPEAAGLGIEIDKAALQKYLVPVEIAVKGRTLYRSPALD